MRQALREALILLSASVVLGVAYSFVTNKGLFLKAQEIQTVEPSNLEMITLATARELFDSKTALFVDARHEFDYGDGHIQGAVNVELKSFDSHRARLTGTPKSKLLVVYCDGAECNSSIELALKLMDSGFMNVKVFFGGWQEWKSAGLPSEK
jgi:rhodanese-related sulfurtransferase